MAGKMGEPVLYQRESLEQRAADIIAELPKQLEFLKEPHRYKVIYGGRGGAKSWTVARYLLALGVSRTIRVVCAREIRRSLKDSVRRLLIDQIEALGFGAHYSVADEVIKGANGSTFLFAGLKHNVEAIRSHEGVDICWVEEAQGVSRQAWETLIPTIRKEGSEIWVTFNPRDETDETWQRFVVRPPKDAVVRAVSWRDNGWFSDVLYAECEDLRERDPDAHAHIWEGQCRKAVEGAVYGEEMARARSEGRLTSVPYDPSTPVHTFWDLGWSDCVSIWMAQAVGLEFRVIDFLQGALKPVDWYVGELNKRGYVWGEDWLPHDARAETLAAAGRTIESQMKSLGRTVRIVEQVPVTDGINAARGVLRRCWFDADRCAEGLNALRHYRYDVDEDGRLSRKPRHDWASHGADAFRYLAVSLEARRPKAVRRREYGQLGWMG